MSLSSCYRYHPAEVKRSCQPDFDLPCCLRPETGGSAFGKHSRGHLCVHFRYGPMTRRLPQGSAVGRLHEFGLPLPCYPSYRALIVSLAGLSPAGHTSLRWTHGFPCCCYFPLPCVPAPLPRRVAVGARVARFPTGFGLPLSTGGSALALTVSRPARRSLTFRPAWSLSYSRSPFTPVGSGPGAPALRLRWLIRRFRSGPQSGCRNYVSRPRHVEPRRADFPHRALLLATSHGLWTAGIGSAFLPYPLP